MQAALPMWGSEPATLPPLIARAVVGPTASAV